MQVNFNEEGKALNQVFDISKERTDFIKTLVVKAVKSEENFGGLDSQLFIIRSLTEAATFCENESEIAYLFYLGAQAWSKATSILSMLKTMIP